ncbi:MAG: DNA recombination protein RmuC [Flavobacteriales bacterium]|nr:DNA recombination protein RmuC [Bacteroidota bacterium]MCB9241436.1 DNA recombination protein RmuC [Flavobacteriales bacterium]
MDFALFSFIISLLSLIVLIAVWLQSRKNQSVGIEDQLTAFSDQLRRFNEALDRHEKTIRDEFQRNRTESADREKTNRNELAENLQRFSENFKGGVKDIQDGIHQKFADFAGQQQKLNEENVKQIKDVRSTIEKQLESIREDNTKQLDEMRKTVDEKLQTTLEKRLGESFKQVSERLELVHKGLGEMQNLASGVGDLKKVLSNVKTRGVMGEYQLENILEQLLTPDQYAKNVPTKLGSQAHVEFAVKLPGKDSDDVVWMPIDSKFPIENYQLLQDAYEQADTALIESSQKELLRSLDTFARDISSKYLDPPHTTDFAIMFLPIEGLYAEVLRHPGLFENLQRKYRITITGPTTLSALLNSLQMGFRTLAVQKRSSEVWKILEAVKTEFGNFSKQLDKVDKQLSTASKSLNDLRLTRTNVLSRKLKDVGTIELGEAHDILQLSEGGQEPDDESLDED